MTALSNPFYKHIKYVEKNSRVKLHIIVSTIDILFRLGPYFWSKRTIIINDHFGFCKLPESFLICPYHGWEVEEIFNSSGSRIAYCKVAIGDSRHTSAQISQGQDGRNIHVIMKTMCHLDYHHTVALWQFMH